ncbi:hypothetical protein KBB49_00600 [Candidatus Saccharibacteria bacterium]|nr:hypothetical protein [Candidatus Saccharibacteria bacterium]
MPNNQKDNYGPGVFEEEGRPAPVETPVPPTTLSLSERKKAVLARLAGGPIEGKLEGFVEGGVNKKPSKFLRNVGKAALATGVLLAVSPTARETAGNIADAVVNIGPNSEDNYDFHNTNTNETTLPVEVSVPAVTPPVAP